MKLIKNNNLQYYKFENLNVKHFFSTRIGGVSEGCYESLNLEYRQDDPENVVENYRRICTENNIDYRNTVWTKQVHKDRILKVGYNDRGTGLIFSREEEGYDAIITNCKDVALTGFSADCVLLFFYAPDVSAIGIAHSGWRGTVLETGKKTVEALTREYGADPSVMLSGISPAIGYCCFQVDRPVVDEFKEKLPFSEEFIRTDTENAGKYYIDLHGINQKILENAGLKPENIENSRICTKCDPDKFYSHRIMGKNRGTLAGIISL